MRAPLALALVLGACGFKISPNIVEIDAPQIVDDGGGLAEAWSFDSAAEFAVAGHERVSMVIEPRGSLTPEGYIYGGLLGRGETTTKLWSVNDTAWTKLAAVTPTGAGLWSGQPLATTQDLSQFGILRNAVLRTLWFEGEILLRAGTEQLRITGDDIAFVAVAEPGTSMFTPLLETGVIETAPVVVPTAGWYPVRVGWADGDASGDLALEIENDQGNFEAISPHRLRATAANLQGMLRTVFYRQMHGGGVRGGFPVQHVQAAPFFPPTQFAPPLQGSVLDTAGATGDTSDWSARWAGQLYVATPGQYMVRVTSDDGNRVLLASQAVVETSWARNDSNGSASSTITAALREGWNDLIVDYNQAAGETALAVQVVTSPDPSLTGVPVPVARLRPVEPRGDRMIVRTAIPDTAVPVADDTGQFSDVSVVVAARPDQVVTRVDVTVIYSTYDADQLVFRVVRPGGPPVIVRRHPNVFGGGNGLTLHAFSIDAGAIGGPADGTWAVGVADDVNDIGTNTTTIDEVHLTLHTSGGPEQIVRAATWQTPIKDLGTTLVKVDAITWDHRAPTGTAVELRLRSCAQADCSDEPSWGAVVVNGMPVVLVQQRYLQAQVTMTSDGANEAELRSLQIMYRRAAGP